MTRQTSLLSMAALLAVALSIGVTVNAGAQNPNPPDEPLTLRVDLKTDTSTGPGPTDDWLDVQIRPLLPPSGGMGEPAQTVELRGAMVGGPTRTELLEILADWNQQRGTPFDATLEVLDGNQQVLRTIDFIDAVPVEYCPPSVSVGSDDLLEECFAFRPERVEDSATSNGSSGSQQARVSERLRHKNRAVTAVNGDVLRADDFQFNFDGQTFPCSEVDAGAGQIRFGDGRPGTRPPTSATNEKEFTVTKPGAAAGICPSPGLHGSLARLDLTDPTARLTCGTWKVSRQTNQTDLDFLRIFQEFARGDRTQNPADTGSLIYLKRDGQTEARRIDFSGFLPISYRLERVQDDNGGACSGDLREVLKFEVLRCDYR